MVYHFLRQLRNGICRALPKDETSSQTLAELAIDFQVNSNIGQGALTYESHLVDPNAGRDNGRIPRMYNQELRASTDDATHQQDERTRRPYREEFERNKGRRSARTG